MSDELNIIPVHFKLQTWAPDKVTGLVTAMILPSIRCSPETLKDFDESGHYQKLYDAFREFCLRNNPNIRFVGEKQQDA